MNCSAHPITLEDPLHAEAYPRKPAERLRKLIRLDDHFDRRFLFMAMKGKIQNQIQNQKYENNQLTSSNVLDRALRQPGGGKRADTLHRVLGSSRN
jgi:hypothetical protein